MRGGLAAAGWRVALVLTGAAGLCGCANALALLDPPPVDPTSAVAPQVTAASRADLPTPSFRDIPPTPTNVRAAPAVQADEAAVLAQRQRLQAVAAANPVTDPNTEAFAAQARARIPESERTAPPPDASGTEELAARLRALATPPPSPTR